MSRSMSLYLCELVLRNSNFEMLSSSMRNGCHLRQAEEKLDAQDEKDPEANENRYEKASTTYDSNADQKWLKTIDHLDVMEAKCEGEILEKLVANTEAFRWQGSTGFTSHNRGILSHLRPKWRNPKELLSEHMPSALSRSAFTQRGVVQ